MTRNSNSPDRKQLWLIPSQGRARFDRVAEVAVDVATQRTYSYGVPEALGEQVRPGAFVSVSLRSRRGAVDGLCVRVTEAEWDHTRPVLLGVKGAHPLLNERLIELGLWISEYYCCPPYRTLHSLFSAAAASAGRKRVAYLRRTEAGDEGALTEKQRSLLGALCAGEPTRRDDALRTSNTTPAILRRLIKRGLVEQILRREDAEPLPGDSEPACATEAPEDRFVLSDEQAAVLAEIEKSADGPDGLRVFLLFGVAGSGKTEVYVRSIQREVAAGRQAIIIVPEIALTTQLVDRVAGRFPRVSILHSRLTAAARGRALRAIAAGMIDVVIGTRSAVFAPCRRLGIIVVDEEQDGSLKHLASPRYHARDVAIKRAQIEHCPVLLGSATPALETWYNARHLPHYRLLCLPKRVGDAKPPEVRLVCSGETQLGQMSSTITPLLAEHIGDALASKEQVILLHNRRGYAVNLRCTSCGLGVVCQRCGSRMAYHRSGDTMKCHACGLRAARPDRCLDATCGGRLERSRAAIQKLEEELGRRFPSARLLRLDSDTMRHREDYKTTLRAFERHEADILLGTQMVAKGLDFPHVRLVGVIEADTSLWLPDFRAAERTFQLVTQVVGRAGRRGGASLAIVQTVGKPAAAIRYAMSMDYESFARAELESRRRHFYPPFSRVVRWICLDARPNRARLESAKLAEALRECGSRVSAGIQIGDAEPCPILRLRDMQRYHVIMRAPRDGSAQRLIADAMQQKLLRPRVQRFVTDVDPIDLM